MIPGSSGEQRQVVGVEPLDDTRAYVAGWREAHPSVPLGANELRGMRANGLVGERVTYEGADGQRWTQPSFRSDPAVPPTVELRAATTHPEEDDAVGPHTGLPMARLALPGARQRTSQPPAPPRRSGDTLGGVPTVSTDLFRPLPWTQPAGGRHRGFELEPAPLRRRTVAPSAGAVAISYAGNGRRRASAS